MSFYFEKLIVWQKSLTLTKKIYAITKRFPSEEQYILCSQMRRAAISIMSNIAEGSGRASNTDRNHFFTMAKSSGMELASQLIFAKEVEYSISLEEYDEISRLIEDIASMLYALTQK